MNPMYASVRDPRFLFLILPLIVACDAGVPASGDGSLDPPTMPNVFQSIPFAADAFDLIADDFNGNGRLDLAFTSHNQNFSQIFIQREPRRFEAGPRIDRVGFHPGDLFRLPNPDRRLYLMNAEGENRLMVMEPNAENGLDVVSELGVRFPRTSALFNWPDWGMGLAIAPFGSAAVILVKGFDPLEGKTRGAIELPFRPAHGHADTVVAADLDHDGSDEILLTNSWGNEILIIRGPDAESLPELETLWRSEHGGRFRDILPVDINRDGFVDLLVPDETGKTDTGLTSVNVLLNDQKGGIVVQHIPFPARTSKEGGIPGIRGLDFGIDADGLGYLFAAGYEDLVLYRVPDAWSAEPLEMRSVKLPRHEGISKVLVVDLDGDGWLDVVLARNRAADSGFVLYGPLWDSMGTLAEYSAVLE